MLITKNAVLTNKQKAKAKIKKKEKARVLQFKRLKLERGVQRNDFESVLSSGFLFHPEDIKFYDENQFSPLFYTVKNQNYEFT